MLPVLAAPDGARGRDAAGAADGPLGGFSVLPPAEYPEAGWA